MTVRFVVQAARAALVASVLAAVSAHAALVSTTAQVQSYTLSTGNATWTRISDPVPGEDDSIDGGPKAVQSVLTFGKFDTSLGTLVGVDFSWSRGWRRELSLLVNGFESPGWDNHADAFFEEALIGAGLISSLSATRTLHVNCTIQAPPGCSDSQGVAPIGPQVTAFSGLAPLLLNFAGPGTFDLTASLSADITDLTYPDNGTSTANANARSSGSVSLIYTYEARAVEPPPPSTVPEPLSLGLVGIALAGLAYTRRRRR